MNRRQAIKDLAASTARPFDLDPSDHVHVRSLRRITAADLKRAVFERDTEGMEFAIRRLHRLGVKRDVIEQIVGEVQL